MRFLLLLPLLAGCATMQPAPSASTEWMKGTDWGMGLEEVAALTDAHLIPPEIYREVYTHIARPMADEIRNYRGTVLHVEYAFAGSDPKLSQIIFTPRDGTPCGEMHALFDKHFGPRRVVAEDLSENGVSMEWLTSIWSVGENSEIQSASGKLDGLPLPACIAVMVPREGQ